MYHFTSNEWIHQILWKQWQKHVFFGYRWWSGGKYKKNWDVIKNKINIKFHSKPIYDQKYLKAKVREFNGVIKTNFWGNETPKGNIYYTCIACTTIDSVMRMDKKNYPQVYLEECKDRVKKIQMSRFISAKLESDSESNSEVESKSDTELMAKLKSSSDSDSERIILLSIFAF